MSEQTKQIARVRGAISGYIIDFFGQREGREFYNIDLHDFVSQRASIAPGSADRIMRDLRAKGLVNYTVVDRSRSLYRALPIEPAQGVLFT